MPPPPSIETQNLILEHLNYVKGRFGVDNTKFKGLLAAGTPFVKKVCNRCDVAQYTNVFTMGSRGKGNSGGKPWVYGFCSSCRNERDRTRYVTEIQESEKEDIMGKINCMIKEVKKKTPTFDERPLLTTMTSVLEGGFRQIAYKVVKDGILTTHQCTKCMKDVFIWQVRMDSKAKKGYRGECAKCASGAISMKAKKVGGMARRCGSRGDGYELWDKWWEAQKGLDYYTFMPLEDKEGSPWTPSPERIERGLKDYEGEGFTVLCCEVFNVGGTCNFTHKLVLQTYFSSALKTHYKDQQQLREGRERRYIMSARTNAAHRARKKAKQASRNDESWHFDITFDDLVHLAEKQGFRCAVSGVPLVFKPNHPWSASLDRILNPKGYIRSNIRWVVQRYNPRITWTDEMAQHLMQTLRGTVHKVWEAHFGDNKNATIEDLQEPYDADVRT
jgi:hypothetical protein